MWFSPSWPIRRRSAQLGARSLARALAISLSVFCLWSTTGCHKKEKKKTPPQTVSTLKLQPQTVRVSREFVGRTEALLSVDIRSQVSGYITGFFFHEGEFVRKGQVLFQIDPAPYKAQVEASLAQVARADADIAQAEAQLAKAQDAVARYAPLAPIDAIPRQQYADALAEQRVRAAEVLQMRANRRIAEGSLEQARLRLGFTTLSSPISGIAGLRRLSTGSLASAEDPQPLTTVSLSDPIRVTFALADADYLRYIAPGNSEHREGKQGRKRAGRTGRAGQTKTSDLQGKDAINPVRDMNFRLLLADGSTYGEPGRFYAVGRVADPQTDTVDVALLYPNPENRLRPGQYAKVRTDVELRKDVLLVPVNSVQQMQGTRLVWVVGPNNEARQRRVDARERAGNAYIVTSGLQPGDTVIVGGEQKLRPGDKVKPHPTNPAQLQENSRDSSAGSASQGNGQSGGQSSGQAGQP